jgi:DMSO/TMAO reductase YedYZ molybdopterin-dependent catalytic subunit
LKDIDAREPPAHQSFSTGLIIRQNEPRNLETPFDQLDSFVTPAELFYIRSHFRAPKLDASTYRLRIDGAVQSPLSVSYQELRDMPFETRPAILECARNSRVFLVPQVKGAKWELGQYAMLNGQACLSGLCWSGLAWKMTRARSCSRERTRGLHKRSQYLPDQSHTPEVCPERRRRGRKYLSLTR